MPTKRQRVISEEETPFPPITPKDERITRAEQRIKELQTLIQHWKQQQ